MEVLVRVIPIFKEMKMFVPVEISRDKPEIRVLDGLKCDWRQRDAHTTWIKNEPFSETLTLVIIDHCRGYHFARFIDSKNNERLCYECDLLEILKSPLFQGGKITANFIYSVDNNHRFYSVKLHND